MNRQVSIPSALHEVLGRVQTPAHLVLITLAGLGLGFVICIAGAGTLADVAPWRATLAVLLIVDVAAGCVANFTPGTDAHYAGRPRSRWVFIAVHWHLVVIGVLLGVAPLPLLLITLSTLCSAALVNLLHGHRLQVTVGGALMATGITGVTLWMPAVSPVFLVATAALFVIKVVFAFAVTHHGSPNVARIEANGQGA